MSEDIWRKRIRIFRDIILVTLGVILVVTEVILVPANESPDPLVLGLITLLLGFPVGSLADRIKGDS